MGRLQSADERAQVRSMVEWLHGLVGIVDCIEVALHRDGAWTGRLYVITPEVHV